MSFKRNVAVTGLTFVLVNRTDGVSVTAGTCGAWISKDGAAQAAAANNPVHLGGGQWSVDLTAGEMDADTVGLLLLHDDAVPVHLAIRTTSKLVSDLSDLSQSQITGGAYALDTDANGRVRHVVGTGAGELDTEDGKVAAQVDGVDVTAIAGSADAATKLATSVDTMVLGTVDDAAHTPSPTVFQTDLGTAGQDHYKGRVLIFTAGGLARQATVITAFDLVGGRGQFTVEALTAAPSSGDAFVIV